MKKYLQFALLAVFTITAGAQMVPPPKPDTIAGIPQTPPKPDAMAALIKERDEAKAALQTAQAATQQQGIITEYYKAAAERNEALLRLGQVQAELEQTKQALTAATKRADDLQAAKGTPAK